LRSPRVVRSGRFETPVASTKACRSCPLPVVLARRCAGCFDPESDRTPKTGGEEFAVGNPYASPDLALVAMHKVRAEGTWRQSWICSQWHGETCFAIGVEAS
jgi:formate-dependent nitrite reductase cytochrome c552 subunit